MTVYWDMMFLINFAIDYIILYSTAKTLFLKRNIFKILSGALIGGIYGIFAFEKSFVFNTLTYIFVTFFILYVTFSKLNFKIVSTFYIISFLFGGISGYLNNLYGVIKMSNGFFYIENNLLAVILGVVLSSFIVVISLKLIKRNTIKLRQIKTVDIFCDGKSVTVSGMLDTGNLLLDPITKYPVILVNFSDIKQIINKDLEKFLEENDNLCVNINRRIINKIRLIPYKNSSSNDILKGFKPDYIVIKEEKERKITDVIIAVTYNKLSENNEFNAILNPQI
ncbi:MAG: hypothetical protein E7419_00370 [Ruminococcaceae bacterium]|nr:hypothetical protein [Oscillospiraceae bacterium]